jgi:hypothetical protein
MDAVMMVKTIGRVQYEILLKLGKMLCEIVQKADKVEVYRFLKNLENKGLVESTLERPTRFAAAPFEEVLDDLISKRRRTTAALQEQKDKILGVMNVASSMPHEFNKQTCISCTPLGTSLAPLLKRQSYIVG